jgi:hypothetical protein
MKFKKVRCIKDVFRTNSGRRNDEKVLVLPFLFIAYGSQVEGITL